jgi:hypothetical protein
MNKTGLPLTYFSYPEDVSYAAGQVAARDALQKIPTDFFSGEPRDCHRPEFSDAPPFMFSFFDVMDSTHMHVKVAYSKLSEVNYFSCSRREGGRWRAWRGGGRKWRAWREWREWRE